MGAPPGQPPAWAVYFGTDDFGAAVARAEGAGGQKVFGPMQVPSGTFAVMRDPQGAHFSLFAGEFDD
jgi:predicted enzyme related to lactoylglutathione lyase